MVLQFSLGMQTKFMVTQNKLKTSWSDISPILRNAPIGEIVLNVDTQNDIINPITHAKFYFSRFGVFGVLQPQNLHYTIGLAGRSYNSVSTIMLYSDISEPVQDRGNIVLWLSKWVILQVTLAVWNLSSQYTLGNVASNIFDK